MAEPDKKPVTLEELLVSSLAQTDALAKILVEQSLTTRTELMANISMQCAYAIAKGRGNFQLRIRVNDCA
jgi:hypothetical protein